MRQVRFKFRCNILITGKIIKEVPDSVASGTQYTSIYSQTQLQILQYFIMDDRFRYILDHPQALFQLEVLLKVKS